MTTLLPRLLKVTYRREPISSFILIVGIVDAVIGGVGGRWSLLSLGLTIAILGIVVRWWRNQQLNEISQRESPRGYLPPQSSQNPLPILGNDKHRPPY